MVPVFKPALDIKFYDILVIFLAKYENCNFSTIKYLMNTYESSQREKPIQASNSENMGLATIYLTIPLPQKFTLVFTLVTVGNYPESIETVYQGVGDPLQ